MYYLLEIWKGDECETANSLTRRHAQKTADTIYEEYMATAEAAGLVPDISIKIHQCVQAIEFKPKGDQK